MKFKLVEDINSEIDYLAIDNLNESYTDEEIKVVIDNVRRYVNGTTKFIPLKTLRLRLGMNSSIAVIFNKLSDSDIIAILKENARDIKISNRNKGLFLK